MQVLWFSLENHLIDAVLNYVRNDKIQTLVGIIIALAEHYTK